MKIAFVIFGESEIGGAEKRFANLFNALKDNKEDEFYFIISGQKYCSIKSVIKDFSHPNILILGADKRVRFSTLITNAHKKDVLKKIKSTRLFNWLKRTKWYIHQWLQLVVNTLFLYKCIRKYKINVVHTIWRGSFAASFLKLFYAKFYHVLTYMDVYCDRISRRFIDLPISYSLSLKKADHIDFLGETYLKELQRSGFSFINKNISISPCSFINMPSYLEGEKNNIVVFACRFASKKNPMLFIETAERILQKRDDIKFEMYGKGDLDNEIREYLKSKNLTEKIKVEYTEEIEKVFQRSKIFLSLQDIDNYPSQAILEAMYFKNVVIATNTGETKKIVPSETGFLVGFDKVEIAAKIEYLIDNPVECSIMADNASKFVFENHLY